MNSHTLEADFGENRLVDVKDAARLLGTGERFARRIFDERRVPTVKVGRHVRVWTDDLAEYVTRNTRPATERAAQ